MTKPGASSGPVLVTGGCGVIGGNFVHAMVGAGATVVTLDALTYAASPRMLTRKAP